MPRWLALLLATLVAPAAAGPVGIATVLALHGKVGAAAGSLALAPIMLLTIPGIYAYATACLPALAIGGALFVAAERVPSLRRKRVWAAAGGLAGLAAGIAWVPWAAFMTASALAGIASALTFRLIVGRSWQRPAAATG